VRPLPVRWRPEAVQDLKDIHDWIVSESGYPQVAADYIDRVINAGENLGEFPEKGHSRDDLAKGIRIIPFARSTIIVYRIHADEVQITNVFHGGRDYETILRNR
jgi:toxin ParE1/3/4